MNPVSHDHMAIVLTVSSLLVGAGIGAAIGYTATEDESDRVLARRLTAAIAGVGVLLASLIMSGISLIDVPLRGDDDGRVLSSKQINHEVLEVDLSESPYIAVTIRNPDGIADTLDLEASEHGNTRVEAGEANELEETISCWPRMRALWSPTDLIRHLLLSQTGEPDQVCVSDYVLTVAPREP